VDGLSGPGVRRFGHDVRVNREPGRVEVIAGPMFAGKTEELLRRVRRAVIAGRNVQVLTHTIDTREGTGRVASHAGLGYESEPVSSADEIRGMIDAETDMVAIDEAHFFGPDLAGVVGELAARDVVVVVAGLDVTFAGLPFEPMPSLMALAERVDKLTAICTICGAEAIFHCRVTPAVARDLDLVTEHVGGAEKYQARCRRHFEAPNEGPDFSGR
jgi:thymidine kinase